MFPIKIFLIIITIFCGTNEISSTKVTSNDARSHFHQINIQQQIKNLYQQFDYCNHNCWNAYHTACVPGGGRCRITSDYGAEYVPMTSAQRDAIVNLHNRLRNKVAGGEESRAHLGGIKIADMRPLEWSPEAEYIAECHVKKCDFNHDLCRKLRNDMSCGQNLALKIPQNDTKNAYEKHDFWSDSIYAWYEEIEKCGCNFDEPFGNKTNGVTAFTQFIWAKTQYIGCAYMKFAQDSEDKILLICNYCPAGNIVGENAFTIGNIQGDCNVDPFYLHLCNPTDDTNQVHQSLGNQDMMERSDYEEEGSGEARGSGAESTWMKTQRIDVVFVFFNGFLLNRL